MDEETIVDQIRSRNFNMRKDFDSIKRSSKHSNVVMIVDEIIKEMGKYSRCLEEKNKICTGTKKEDMKIWSFREVRKADPESLQSVLLYISGKLGEEVNKEKELIKNLNQDYVKKYVEAMDKLRIDVEYLYHNLVEKQL